MRRPQIIMPIESSIKIITSLKIITSSSEAAGWIFFDFGIENDVFRFFCFLHHFFTSKERHRGVTVVPWIFVDLHTLSAVDLQLQNEASACGSR